MRGRPAGKPFHHPGWSTKPIELKPVSSPIPEPPSPRGFTIQLKVPGARRFGVGILGQRVLVTGILLLCGTAHGQIAVSGRVLDENGAAVPLASVQFQDANTPEARVETSTGPSGNFALALPRAGSYRTSVKCNGFFTLENKTLDFT